MDFTATAHLSGRALMPPAMQSAPSAAATAVLRRWGWRGTKPGDWAELEIDTRASDGSPHTDTYVWCVLAADSLAGASTRLAAHPRLPIAMCRLSHLSSYAGMGTARVECVSGCKCATDRLDGTWLRQASLFTIMRFHVGAAAWLVGQGRGARAQACCAVRCRPAAASPGPPPQVTRHKQCRFRVTVLPRPGKYPQKGHKVRWGLAARRGWLEPLRRLGHCQPPVPTCAPQVTLAAVMVTHVPLGMGAGESSLGLVENIGLTHDRGWKEEDR